jgi:hypothetical protein
LKDLIPEAEGISLALEIAKEEGLSDLGKPDYLAFLMKSCPVVLRKEDQKRYIKYEDLASFFHNARKWINEKDQRPLARQRGYKVDRLPDVLEVAESDEYLGMKGSLFPSVKEALWEIWHGDKIYLEVVLTGATGCLVGDTQLQINRRNRKTRGSANRVYNIRTAYERTANLGSRYRWDSTIPTKLLSLKDDSIGYHTSTDIVYSGRKPVYTLTTDKGKQITVTAEHPFRVPDYSEGADKDGFKQLQELIPGDKVLCRAEKEVAQGRQPNRRRRWVYSIQHHPLAMKQVIGGKDYKRNSYARLLIEADMNGLPVDKLIHILRHDKKGAEQLVFLPQESIVHHKDLDPMNDVLSNLVVIDKATHDKLHGAHSTRNFKHRGTQEETVVSIKSAGEQETFDVLMDAPYHNYVANDFIVHNTGKSFLMETSICYMLVRLSYMWDPQAELDLAKGTPIYLVFQAGNLEQAKNILFRPLFNRVSGSPYFQKNFPWNKDMHNELWFPNNIIVKPFSGSNDAVLGLTVVGGGITELNRMAYVTKSKKAKTAEDMLYDQAKSIYQTLIRRMVSRTMQLGKLWGKLFLDAAHEHEDDFTSHKIREAATNDHMYVYKKCQWEAIPQERFGGDKFLVEVGDRTRRSRILNTIDEAVNIDQVVRIPLEYKQWFDQDVEGALRDFGGIVVTGHRPAIPFREKIAASFAEHKKLSNGRQLFTQELVVINDYQDAFDALLDREYLDTTLLDKRVSFAAHVDPALKHDCAGLVIGHIIGWKMLQGIKVYEPRTRTYRTQSEGKAPIVMIDGLLQITAPYGEEIDLDAIQNFVIFLKEILNLEAVSADGYQSAQMIQSWRKAGFITGVVSMDTSVDPYNRVKAAYRDDRLYVPYHPTYEREIINLQYENGKYDHLPGGGHSKDIADGVAGVVYLLETHLADLSTRPSRATRPSNTSRNRGSAGRRISGRII